jgi:hypothetical protein
MLKRIPIAMVVVLALFLAYAATRPDTYTVERAAVIEAPATVVFDQLDDFQSWAAWSPWDKLDPHMTKTFEGPESGVGAAYGWQGNDQVGKGRMTIVESSPPRSIAYELEFIEPFAAMAATRFELDEQDDGASRATWRMDGTNNFMSKVFGIFMDMDAAIGADFERGLASLKTVSETQAKRAAAQDAEAQAAQAQAAQARAAAQAAGSEQPAAAPAAGDDGADQP